MPTDQSTPLTWRETIPFSQRTRGVDVTHLTQQHTPDFLLTWRPVSVLRDIFMPDLGIVHLSRADGQEAPSEAEALRRWLAAGGDLGVASRYDLEIIVGDDDNTLDWLSKEPSGEEANSAQSRTA